MIDLEMLFGTAIIRDNNLFLNKTIDPEKRILKEQKREERKRERQARKKHLRRKK